MNAYIDAYSLRIIYEYPGDGVKAISLLKSQCANTTFYDQSIYNRLFPQVAHKGGESEINYIKRVHNAKALEISVGNSYSEDQMMFTLLENSQKRGKYSSKIASHQEKLSIEEKFIDQHHYLYLTCKLII